MLLMLIKVKPVNEVSEHLSEFFPKKTSKVGAT